MRSAIVIFAALLLAAAPAQATEVTLTLRTTTEPQPCEPFGGTGCALGDTYDRRIDMPTVDVAGTAAADVLKVDVTAGTVTVTGAGVTAGKGCEQTGADAARCSDPPPATSVRPYELETRPILNVALGPGDDRLAVATMVTRSGRLEGGDGADTMTAPGNAVSGGAGDDVLSASIAVGGDGDDRLAGGRLDGGPGADTLTGGDAGGTFTGGPGADLITAGSGPNDRIDESTSTEPVMIDLTGAGRDGADLATGVESAVGGKGADTLIGTDAANQLDGREGDDVITGAGGADTIRGGDGADTVEGGAGADDIRGELGADRLGGGDGDDYLAGQTDAGQDPPVGSGGLLDGGGGDDRLFGSVDPERIMGGAGDDEISGGGGRDRISAGAGDDRVPGSQRPARVDLGPGDDVLDVPNGARFTCGTGTDLVTLIDAGDLLAADCERVNPFLVGRAVARPRFVAPHSVAVPLNGRCERTRKCRITARIRGVARRTVRTDGRATVVRLPFPRARRGRPVVVALRAVDGKGRVERAAIRLVL